MIDISLSIIDLDTPKACVAWLLGAGVKPLQATPPPLHEFSAVKSFFVVVSSRQVYRISIQSTPLVTRDLNLFMSLVFSSFKKPDKSLKKHLAIFLLGGGRGRGKLIFSSRVFLCCFKTIRVREVKFYNIFS